MRSALRRFVVALALAVVVAGTRPAPVQSQQVEARLLFCAGSCLYHAIASQCRERTNEQCASWYAGCLEGCMFAI